jgi:hypothetical protein
MKKKETAEPKVKVSEQHNIKADFIENGTLVMGKSSIIIWGRDTNQDTVMLKNHSWDNHINRLFSLLMGVCYRFFR